jgi:hypothetical protein
LAKTKIILKGNKKKEKKKGNCFHTYNQGTGSIRRPVLRSMGYLSGFKPLHLDSRSKVAGIPNSIPFFFTACNPYSEQLGEKVQEVASCDEKNAL